MKVFAVAYPIHFDDTMAYGTHHFMTGFRMQCAGREGLLFGPWLWGHPGVKEALGTVHLLTVDAYSRNLGSAALGEVLAVLVSVEGRGRTSLTFCFRVFDRDKRPVTAGFQTVACADPATGAVREFPPVVLERFEALAALDEPRAERTFRERALQGGRAVAGLFDDAHARTARAFLAGPAVAGIETLAAVEAVVPVEAVTAVEAVVPIEAVAEPPGPALPSAWVFSGQGTLDPALLASRRDPADDAVVVRVVRERLGVDPSPLWDPARCRAALEATPDLDQVGIFLQNVWGARQLMAAGRSPRVLVGHSFGELAAVTVAGCTDLAGGLALVCTRVLALRGSGAAGGLLAVGAPAARVGHAPGCVVAGRNAADRVTVAGPIEALDALAEGLRAEGISAVPVASRHPFHHPALGPASRAWRATMRAIPLVAPTIPVYSPIGRRLLGGGDLLRTALASALIRPFDLYGALQDVVGAGVTELVDVGTTGLVSRLLEAADTGARVGRVQGGRVVGVSRRPTGTDAPDAAPEPGTRERPTIAIVGTGAVVPGSGDPQALFRQLLAGRTGIVDLAEDPDWARDFFVRGGAPDKTRSGLAGVVRDDHVVRPGAVSESRWAAWSRGQRLLAAATAQCAKPAGRRVWCLVGATADGFDDYDLALVLEAFGADLDLEGAHRTLGLGAASAAERAPRQAIGAVLRALWGPDTEITVLDAACASSLYAVALGMRALETGAADVVLAGGVFCPGPGNSALFSQFDGLSKRGCRPFDRAADGVVFGEGASLVVLQRLADAEPGTVRALVRGAGLASDGLSPSANVPRQAGQELAMRRCYDAYGLSPGSVQVIEAHGTATPVGDATELRSLAAVFGPGPVEVRSSKGLVGHTGWAAGTTSLVALCEAFAAGVLHGQAPHAAPSDAAEKAAGVLRIAAGTGPWPDRDGIRRAAVDSFGFGGADAHVVLDAPGDPTIGGPVRAAEEVLVVVSAAGLFPSGPFVRAELRVPDGVGVLPDIAEDMDPTQTLALDVVGRALASVDPGTRHDTALVLVHEGKTERGREATQAVMVDHLKRRLGPGPWSARIDAVRSGLRPSGPYTLQGMMPNVAAGRAASRFDLRGPNFAIDAGPEGLDRALAAARLLVGDSASLVIVAAISAAGSVLPGRREGAAAFVVTTASRAAELGLPVRCRLEPVATEAGPQDVWGAASLLDAIESGAPAVVPLGGGRGVRVVPSIGDGLRLCTPVLVPAPLGAAPRPPRAPLFVAPADAALVRALLAHGEVCTPGMVRLDPRHHPVDLRTEADAEPALAATDALGPDVIVAVDGVSELPVTDAAARDRGALELLFLLAKRRIADLQAGTELWSLCIGGIDRGALRPATGGWAGLLKSIARELPGARVRPVSTDTLPLDRALALLWAERAGGPGIEEIVHERGVRLVRRLQPVDGTRGALPVGPGSVVLATGGARGITAELARTLCEAGATVIALGRSLPEARPTGLPDEPEAAEQAFYTALAAREPGLSPRLLRERWTAASAAWEARATLDRLGMQYRTVDVCDADDVDRTVRDLVQTFGRLDLVVHGAGVQRSARLDRRTLAMFRDTLDVKVGGLHHLLRAVVRHLGRPVPVHALTSAYSVFGNDGQADYGAANETLDRLCALGRRDHGGAWSSVAWLAWDGVGMTRGTEYKALAKARELSGIGPDRGRAVFEAALRGTDAIVVPLSELEERRYGIEVHPPGPPWVRFHEVRGRPTLPGAFALDRLLRAALDTDTPDGGTAVLEDIRFEQFARWGGGADPVLRTEAERTGRWTDTRLMGDVSHSSGHVLQRDVRFCRARVSLQDGFDDTPRVDPGPGDTASDPYCTTDGPVRLSGPFDCLRRIEIGPAGRRAWFDGATDGQTFPALLLDAAWRLGAMHAEGTASGLYVPIAVGRVTVLRDVRGTLQLRAAAPTFRDGVVCCPCVEAVDDRGRVVLRAEDSFARRLP